MILLVGFGFVGQAVYKSITNQSEVRIIDPKRGSSLKEEEIQEALKNNTYSNLIHRVIVCVDTPQGKDDNVDITNFGDVYEDLKDYEGLVIIKSTIPKDLIPEDKNWVYNPEFLNANTAYEDFANQECIILGGDLEFTTRAEQFYRKETLVLCGNYEHVTKDEASDFKYLRNIKQAYNLMYWEFVQDVTGNSRKMAQLMKKMPVSENDLVGLDGFRGFGGACLPKDISAFEKNNPHKLTKYLQDFNEDLKG